MTSTIVRFFVLLLLSQNIRGWYIAFPNNSEISVNNELRETFQPAFIFPGTKWCGSGDIADGPDDLGVFAMTDACCREHDNCKDIIQPIETKHGLTNTAFYTRLHCSCDERFYDCLHSSEELVSAKVGFLYFSVLDTKCFREDYPIVGCKRHSLIPRRCLEYELDESQPKMYQWFDVPTYFQNDHRMVMADRHIRSLDSGTSFAGR
ncbi:PREDICTED: phospholipase A2-like [Trachymyrmex septentrionalis]|uniref:phospholipase A2-like n=1 Tax=Trachymyrmex septentrionalis TaxID=34720 RepID=UPI00084F3D67|nr:PREDICTED: phospholipase A2-like [Trachymyrmex septentrionalis]